MKDAQIIPSILLFVALSTPIYGAQSIELSDSDGIITDVLRTLDGENRSWHARMAS